MLIVLSGPSGVGKDTLLDRLEQKCLGLERCVTYTTRAPRPMEVSGADYHFVSEDEFQRIIAEDGFLEYAKVHLNHYGTPSVPVANSRAKGLDVVLKIDVQGGLTVKVKVPDAVMIFIAPPSLEELERRLRARTTDTEAAITKRLADARNEIAKISEYDYLVVNDDIDTAVDRLNCIITAERSRIVSWD
ncbi:MAG TPA: guanylate kinase [Armatimonadota bacterium]|jgi:guanylate kinase